MIGALRNSMEQLKVNMIVIVNLLGLGNISILPLECYTVMSNTKYHRYFTAISHAHYYCTFNMIYKRKAKQLVLCKDHKRSDI